MFQERGNWFGNVVKNFDDTYIGKENKILV